MYQTSADLIRHINAALCTIAFAGLLWRLIGRWTLSFPLARLLVALFATLELIVALASARRAQIGGPLNEAIYLIMAHAIVTIVVIILWPRLMVDWEHEGHVRKWWRKR